MAFTSTIPLTYSRLIVLRRSLQFKLKKSPGLQGDFPYKMVQARSLSNTNVLRSAGLNKSIYDPAVASALREKIWPGDSLKEEKAVILDISAGPGVMLQELLHSGAKKVICMERKKMFNKHLSAIRVPPDVDLFRMHLQKSFQKVYFRNLARKTRFGIDIQDLLEGVEPVNWEDDIPIKIFGHLSRGHDRNILYFLASCLLRKSFFYRYGRLQLNVIVEKTTCKILTTKPSRVKKEYYVYGLSVLLQFSSDIVVLEEIPESSLLANPEKFRESLEKKGKQERQLCLVQITPKIDLFQRFPMSQQEAFQFVYFIRQIMKGSRLTTLREVLSTWAPGQYQVLDQLDQDEDCPVGLVEPEVMYQLFKLLSETSTFNGHWLCEEAENYALTVL